MDMMNIFYGISFILYLSPIFKLLIKIISFILALFRVRLGMNPFFKRINQELGKWEYLMRLPRNLVFGSLFSIIFIYYVIKGTMHGIPAGVSAWGFLLPTLFLGLISFTAHQDKIMSPFFMCPLFSSQDDRRVSTHD